LGEAGSVRWLFDPKGIITVDATNAEADEIALSAIDAGAEDVQVDGNVLEIYCEPPQLEELRTALERDGFTVTSSESAMLPKTTVGLDEHAAEQTLRLVDRLEELEDVQQVYSNSEVSEEVAASLAG